MIQFLKCDITLLGDNRRSEIRLGKESLKAKSSYLILGYHKTGLKLEIKEVQYNCVI